MLPLVAPLASLLLFSGLVAAQIHAPDCSTSWEWVRFLCVVVVCRRWADELTYFFFSVVQLSRPKCVHSRGVHDVNM